MTTTNSNDDLIKAVQEFLKNEEPNEWDSYKFKSLNDTIHYKRFEYNHMTFLIVYSTETDTCTLFPIEPKPITVRYQYSYEELRELANINVSGKGE